MTDTPTDTPETNIQKFPESKEPRNQSFNKIKEAQKGEKKKELDQAVKAAMEAKNVFDKAWQKVADLEEELKQIDNQKMPVF